MLRESITKLLKKLRMHMNKEKRKKEKELRVYKIRIKLSHNKWEGKSHLLHKWS
jgi:hypothetical protein